jgi:hypothetical protein
MNATFIYLIPNKNNLTTFKNFRSISLRNIEYKVVSKIIENRLKQALSMMVTKEQFVFLFNRKIHDAIRTIKEGFHSIKGGK